MRDTYRLYWNENDELRENEHIKAFLGMCRVDPARRFWTGDAFIVRFSEHAVTYAYDVHDMPIAICQSPASQVVFQYVAESVSRE